MSSPFDPSSIINGNNATVLSHEGTTVKTFSISLASGFILFSVQLTIFLWVRIYPWSKRIFQPRSFLVPLKNRIKPPPNNPFRWLHTLFSIPSTVLLEKSGMDGYFFIRYLTMCLKIFFPMALLILPILLPLNYTDGKGTSTIAGQQYNVTGLDVLAWSNVSPDHTSRYWAHLVLAVVVIAWTCYVFHRELVHYVFKRQEFLSDPSHKIKASATSVLITDIPSDLCTVEKLTRYYDDLPGGLRRVWINRDFKPLLALVEQRRRIEDTLENAETDLLRKCTKKSNKMEGKGQAPKERPKSHLEETPSGTSASLVQSNRPEADHNQRAEKTREATTAETCEEDLQHDITTKAAWTRYLEPKDREEMRIYRGHHPWLFKIPLFGKFISSVKVDTIYFCRRELARLNIEVDREMQTSGVYPDVRSAFLQFNNQKAAHLACQSLGHKNPNAMTKRVVELAPGDINWHNLGIPWWQRNLRFIGFLILFLIVLLVFGLISVFTGILSKISTLETTASWTAWIASLPSWLLSFIQGTLPPIIQIVVLSGPLPIVLRMFTNDIRGATSGTRGERSLQVWYFIFLLFELFILPTISSGLTAAVEQLVHDPASVPNLLATNLPTAANYYFSFLVVQALSISASSILQTIRLLNYYVLGSTNTPDSVFESLTFTNRTRIGSNIPWYTTYAVIGLVYSVIAPLMLLFMLLTFTLFWFVIKNNILYVVRTGNVDGGALFFPDAINQTFTGLYFMEISLIGLFFLVRDAQGKVACGAQGIIMAVVLIGTLIYQWWLYSTFSPLYTYLPVTMSDETVEDDRESESEPLMDDEQPHDAELEANKDESSDPKSSTDESAPTTAKSDYAEGAQTQPNHSTPTKRELSHDGAHESTFDNDKRRSGLSPTSPSTRPRAGSRLSNAHSVMSRAAGLEMKRDRDEQKARRILARFDKPLDEIRLHEMENRLHHVQRAVGTVLLPDAAEVEKQMTDDPISKIIMQHNDELEDLTAEERDLLISVAFTNPVLKEPRPCVWIPQDGIGVSDDEVRRTRELSEDIFIENSGAYFNKKLRVEVDKKPPDMSEFALLVAEL